MVKGLVPEIPYCCVLQNSTDFTCYDLISYSDKQQATQGHCVTENMTTSQILFFAQGGLWSCHA